MDESVLHGQGRVERCVGGLAGLHGEDRGKLGSSSIVVDGSDFVRVGGASLQASGGVGKQSGHGQLDPNSDALVELDFVTHLDVGSTSSCTRGGGWPDKRYVGVARL